MKKCEWYLNVTKTPCRSNVQKCFIFEKFAEDKVLVNCCVKVIKGKNASSTMQIQDIPTKAKKLTISQDGKVVARGRIYFLENDLGHNAPVGYIEDVYVEEGYRKNGYGKQIVEALIEEAKKAGCYKIIGCSRYSREKVHSFYEKMGFKDYGKEFRLDL
jgi:N-acetylglutamate synthase-like GNAT family acetyltransferase